MSLYNITNELREILDTVNSLPPASTGSLPGTVQQATPNITISSNGLITASVTQSAGYVEAGTKSATKQLPTKDGTTIIPTTSEQTIVTAGTYVTGAIKVAAVSGSGSIPTPDAIETCSLTINSNRPEMPISVHYTGINDNTLSLESVLFTDSTKTITCVKNTIVSVMFQAYDDYFNYLVEETGNVENAGQFGDLYCYSASGNGTISFNASE